MYIKKQKNYVSKMGKNLLKQNNKVILNDNKFDDNITSAQDTITGEGLKKLYIDNNFIPIKKTGVEIKKRKNIKFNF